MRTRNNFIRPERTIARLSRELPGLNADIYRWNRMRDRCVHIHVHGCYYERRLTFEQAVLGYIEARIRIAEGQVKP